MAVDFMGESGCLLRIIGVSTCMGRHRQETGLCMPARTGQTLEAIANSPDSSGFGGGAKFVLSDTYSTLGVYRYRESG
jgi:hypothetical protein